MSASTFATFATFLSSTYLTGRLRGAQRSVARLLGIGSRVRVIVQQGVCVAGFLVSSLASLPTACEAVGWNAAASLSDARDNHTATLLVTGKVLVAGGLGDNGSGSVALDRAELYDPASNIWVAAGPLARARYWHTQTLLQSGKVLVAGGLNVSSAELYEPTSNTWSAAGSLAAARYWHTATLLPSGKVLIAGGRVSGQVYGVSAELYDPVSNTWSRAGNLVTGREGHSATLLPSGKVLVAGGSIFVRHYAETVELYDAASNTWSDAYSGDSAKRWMHTATVLPSGKILVAGGSTDLLVGPQTTVEAPVVGVTIYDPVNNVWSSAGSLATARYSHTATLLPSGKVLIAGGRTSATGYSNSSELFDPAGNNWSDAGILATARGLHSATLLSSSKVLIAGGYNSSYLDSAELYTSAAAIQIAAAEPVPALNTWSLLLMLFFLVCGAVTARSKNR